MPVKLDEYCCDRDVAGSFENQILYSMCHDNLGHKSGYVTSGKILAIGRIYAASPERGAGQMEPEDVTFTKALALELKASTLDRMLEDIDPMSRISDADTMNRVICAHKYLVAVIAETTSNWPPFVRQNKSKPRQHVSFASKYLHFHRPNAFPILDSFAKAGLKCGGSKGNIDEYGRFCRAFLSNASKQGELWTPRSIDTELVRRGRIHAATEAEKHCKECGHESRKRKKATDMSC